MKPFTNNPRKISPTQQQRLREWMEELGDLSGVVHDLNSDQIIGGNQRSVVMDVNDCEIEITHTYDPPDEQGTAVLGYIVWQEQRFNYRAVRWTPDQCRKANIIANAAGGEWDVAIMLANFDTADLTSWGIAEADLNRMILEMAADEASKKKKADQQQADARQTLAERFVVPPFSVLDTRQGYWQNRKSAWISLGIRSEVGRADSFGDDPRPRVFGEDLMRGEGRLKPGSADHKEGTLFTSLSGRVPDYYWQKEGMEAALGRPLSNEEFEAKYLVVREGSTPEATGSSIFDPVLCEAVYTWFTSAGGHVLDMFAGGSVRGIVSSTLGRPYTGIDLSARQIEANIQQGKDIVPDALPQWIVGDSREMDALLPADQMYDLLFTCPPYADLEVYSDDPRDISTMPYPQFLEALRDIVRQAVDRLHDDRFACVVIGEVRGRDGLYYRLVPDTIQAFVDAGCAYYNEVILVNTAGSLPIRVGRQFDVSRKVGKTHQNVLVFVKGDPRAAAAWCGDIAVYDALPDDGRAWEVSFDE